MKRGFLWLTFGIALAITVPLRLYQLFFGVDAQGFYTDGGVISYLLLAVLLAAMAVLLFGSFSSQRLPKRFTQERDFPSGVFYFGTGAGAIGYSIAEIISLASGSRQNLSGVLLYVAIILAFFGVGAGMVWLLNGVSCFLRRNLLRWIPVAGILPPLWLAIVLFEQTVQFSGTDVALNTAESMFGTLTLATMALFVFNHCKMIAGAQGKKCGKRVYGYGLSMVLFGVTAALPAFVAWVTGREDAGSMGLLMSIVIGFLCLGTVSFLLRLPRSKDAFTEELVEVPSEEAEASDLPVAEVSENAAQTEQPSSQPETEEKKGGLAGFLLGFLQVMGKMGERIGNLFRRKRPTVEWEPGKLDEKPTMRLDDSWRLDFYGLIEDKDGVPYTPKVYEMDAAEAERQEARRDAVLEELLHPEEEKQQKSKIPEWKQKQLDRKHRYNSYRK